MKKLLGILMMALAFSVNAQNACSTKEQKDASQTICEISIEAMGATVAGAGALAGPVGMVAGAAVGATMIHEAKDWCRGAREAHEKNNPQCNKPEAAEKQSDFITESTFSTTKSTSSNCSATNVIYTSKARR